MAVTQRLQAIYEVDFLAGSFGYRPGLNAHDAIVALRQELYRGHNFVVGADIKGYLENIRWLEVASNKTRRLLFSPQAGPGNGRFDLLGFEFYWEPDRKGRPSLKPRTASKKLRASIQRMTEWVRANRHQKLGNWMKTLKAKLQGIWNYYGLIGNSRRMNSFYDATRLALFKWLNRRSQRRSLSWPALTRLMRRFGVLPPHIVQKIRRAKSLPTGTEFLSEASGTATASDIPACVCESELTLKSPVRENRPPGSVRGAPGNRRPYRDHD